MVAEAGAELAVRAQGADGQHRVLVAGQAGVGGGPEGGGAAVVAGGGDQEGALLAQFPHEGVDAEEAVGPAVGRAGGEAEDVGPAVPVDRLEELLAELGLQHRAGVVECAPHGDVGVGGDGGDESGDERAVAAVLLEDPVLVALGGLGVAVGVGEQRVGAVVVREAGVDDEDVDGGVRVVRGLGGGRVGPAAARDGHGFVAGAGVDGDGHHVVAADQPASGAALGRRERAQGAGDRRVAAAVALARVGDLDAGDAGAVGLGARAAHLVRGDSGEGGEVRAHGVLDDAGLLPVAGEDDTLLVEELARVVRPDRQGDVGHGALDLCELLTESLWCHGMPSTRTVAAGAAELS